jgi:hypothetical protein
MVVLIEADGTTNGSVQAWKATRSMFGTFQEAIFPGPGSDRRYAWSAPNRKWADGNPDAWEPPRMVLRDERSNELWLSGCGAGYRGEGPEGAGYILLKEGFPHEQLRLVLTCERLHLVKGSEPLVAERKPGSSDSPQDADFVEVLLDQEARGHSTRFRATEFTRFARTLASPSGGRARGGLDETRLYVEDEHGEHVASVTWRPTSNVQPGPDDWDYRLHRLGYRRSGPWQPYEGLEFRAVCERVSRPR